MTTCTVCYADNVSGAVQCRGCNRPLASASQLCPKGHELDPTWTECNYCRAEQQFGGVDYGQPSSGASPAYRPTVPERHDVVPASAAIPSRKTLLESLPSASAHSIASVYGGPPAPGSQVDKTAPTPRKTIFFAPTQAGGTLVEATPTTQKIVAVLVTYSWKPEGQIFPIREGRNRIGRSNTECDILVPQDETMSSTHCSITFRTRFVVSDNDTMSGTFVNGTPVEEKSYPLENYDQIRMGSTVWTLVVLQPPAPQVA